MKMLFYTILFFASLGMGLTPLIYDNEPFQSSKCQIVVDKTTTDIVKFTLDNKKDVLVDAEVYNSTKVGDNYCVHNFTILSIIMMIVGFTVAAIILLAAGGAEFVGAIVEGVL